MLVGFGLLAAVVVFAAVLVVNQPEDPDYSADTEDAFLAACTADGGPPVEPVCRCIYTELVASVSYDRFVEINDELLVQIEKDPDADLELPDPVQKILVGCR